MNIKLSPKVIKHLQKIKQKDQKLANRIEKQLALLQENPKHPSLRIHKLKGELSNQWSISITMSIRMTYLLLENDRAYFTDIGTHDEVYTK